MKWAIDLQPVTGEWRVIDGDGEVVAVSVRGEKFISLIAAAPELLEALKEARSWVVLAEDLCRDNSKALALIDAALSKAEG